MGDCELQRVSRDGDRADVQARVSTIYDGAEAESVEAGVATWRNGERGMPEVTKRVEFNTSHPPHRKKDAAEVFHRLDVYQV